MDLPFGHVMIRSNGRKFFHLPLAVTFPKLSLGRFYHSKLFSVLREAIFTGRKRRGKIIPFKHFILCK
jgi:hypothetical protein